MLLYFAQVRCVSVKVLDTAKVEPFRIPSSMTSFNYTELQPSIEYKCSINASTSTETGSTSYILAWTEAVGKTRVLTINSEQVVL